MTASAPATERYTSSALRRGSRPAAGETRIDHDAPPLPGRVWGTGRGPVVRPPEPREGDPDPALGYLAELGEETMVLAWGEKTSAVDRRRIVLAAVIFGRQFDERVAERPSGSSEAELRRFLMGLMNGVVEEFARREGLDRDEAAEFLGEVGTRDHVLEFNEVLDAYLGGEAGTTLDELLREAVESRREKATRAWREPG
jgi:hypothetical protein